MRMIQRNILVKMLLSVLAMLAWIVCFTGKLHGQEYLYRRVARESVENRLKSYKTGNAQRKEMLAALFESAGCTAPNLFEQPVTGARSPNVICRLPGAGESVILVGAHYDHSPNSDGVVDNWSGASLLPSLYESLATEPRGHSFVFIGFTDEEKGLIGSKYYAAHLTETEKERLHAVINLDTLGLSSTKVWQSHTDPHLLKTVAKVAEYLHLPVAGVDVESVGTADSEAFVPLRVPRITLHSVTQSTLSILHTPSDNIKAMQMDDYYQSYRLLAGFLACLDSCAELRSCPDATLPDFPPHAESLKPVPPRE